MDFNLANIEIWEVLNQKLRSSLIQVDSSASVKVYKNIYSAIYESTLGASFFYSHKKSAAFMKGISPFADNMMAHFLREMYQIQYLNFENLENEELTKKWLEDLKKDMSFVLLFEDHFVTDEKYNLKIVVDALNEKKIFHFVVRHNSIIDDLKLIQPYSSYIIPNVNGAAFCFSGSRVKLLNQISPYLNWEHEVDHLSELITFSVPKNEDIIRFEKLMNNFLLINPLNRFYSKTILKFDGVHAELLISKLCQRLGVSEKERKLYFQSTVGCLNPFANFKKWWKLEVSDDDLGSVVVIMIDAINRFPNLSEVILESAEDCRKVQVWT